MATTIQEFIIKVEDKPGQLANVSEAISKAGINIDGVVGLRSEGKGLIHLVTNNAQSTASALKTAGIKHETHELFEIKVKDKPGELAKLARSLGDAGINIKSFYITMHQTQLLDVDNPAGAKKVLEKLGL